MEYHATTTLKSKKGRRRTNEAVVELNNSLANEKDDKDDSVLGTLKESNITTPKKRKLRKPTAEEDIIDGFHILAFKSFEELNRSVSTGDGTELNVQLLKRSEDGSVIKEGKDRKNCKKKKREISSPLPPELSPIMSNLKPKKITYSQIMANKFPGNRAGTSNGNYCSSSGHIAEKRRRKAAETITSADLESRKMPQLSPYGQIQFSTNSPIINDGTSHSELDDRTDLFASSRKGSSSTIQDNLHSSPERTNAELLPNLQIGNIEEDGQANEEQDAKTTEDNHKGALDSSSVVSEENVDIVESTDEVFHTPTVNLLEFDTEHDFFGSGWNSLCFNFPKDLENEFFSIDDTRIGKGLTSAKNPIRSVSSSVRKEAEVIDLTGDDVPLIDLTGDDEPLIDLTGDDEPFCVENQEISKNSSKLAELLINDYCIELSITQHHNDAFLGKCPRKEPASKKANPQKVPEPVPSPAKEDAGLVKDYIQTILNFDLDCYKDDLPSCMKTKNDFSMDAFQEGLAHSSGFGQETSGMSMFSKLSENFERNKEIWSDKYLHRESVGNTELPSPLLNLVLDENPYRTAYNSRGEKINLNDYDCMEDSEFSEPLDDIDKLLDMNDNFLDITPWEDAGMTQSFESVRLQVERELKNDYVCKVFSQASEKAAADSNDTAINESSGVEAECVESVEKDTNEPGSSSSDTTSVKPCMIENEFQDKHLPSEKL